MEAVKTFASNAAAGASSVLDDWLALVQPWQLLLAAFILLLLVIILIGALSARSRRVRDLENARAENDNALRRAEDEARQALKQKDEELSRKKAEMDRALDESREQANQLSIQINELSTFRSQYIRIPDAKAEARRILREAKDQAFVVSSLAEMEYSEIIAQANKEAESIRDLAQQRLTQSHDALRNALDRASKIIEDAHAERNRIAGIGSYEEEDLIDSTAEELEPVPAEEAEEPAPVEEPAPAEEPALHEAEEPASTDEDFDPVYEELFPDGDQ